MSGMFTARLVGAGLFLLLAVVSGADAQLRVQSFVGGLSMPLAILYAWGEATGHRIVLFDAMVRLHGFANAHGFAVCGLLAWIAEDRRRRAA